MPVLNDLIELSGLAPNTTYSVDDGTILGVIDGSTYEGDDDNENGTIEELGNTASDGGILTVGGIPYRITLTVPRNDDPQNGVLITQGSGETLLLQGDGNTSQIAFITATPVTGNGPSRYFAVADDRAGDFSVQSLQTRNLNFAPSGNDVRIQLTADNDTDVVCFAAGTRIETVDGPRAIETIQPGDMVVTRDHGLQPVAWVGHRTLTGDELSHRPALAPIRIRAGALGRDAPSADLVVSPQHRVLVRSSIAQRLFDAPEVLVAAKQLLTVDGIDIATDLDGVTYHHMLFRNHEVVFSNGAETESLFTGPQALKGVGQAAREEILSLFPELGDDSFEAVAARPLPANRQARKLAVRHVQNHRPLVS